MKGGTRAPGRAGGLAGGLLYSAFLPERKSRFEEVAREARGSRGRGRPALHTLFEEERKSRGLLGKR